MNLKILFVIDSLGTGGAEGDLAEKLPHLRYLGVVIVVVSLRHRQEGVQAALQGQGFDVRILPVSGFIRPAAYLFIVMRSVLEFGGQTLLREHKKFLAFISPISPIQELRVERHQY